MSIIVLEDYKLYAGIKNPDKDDKLQYIVDFANTYITNFCGTSFKPVTVLGKKVTCFNGEDFVVPNAPVISVEAIKVLGVDTDLSNLVIDYEEGVVEALTSFPTSRFAIEIDYTYGHSSVPQDLMLSALEFVTHISKREFTKSKNIGGENVDYGDPALIPPHIRLALNIYKVL